MATRYTPEVLAAAGFPTISIDRLRIGETFRSDDRLIRPQDVEAYAFAVDDHDPWFFAPGPWGGPIAHPTLLANQALFLRHTRYHVPAGLHARMVYEFHAPIPLGTIARTTGEVVDTYWRRDKPYMVTAYETVGPDGNLLVSGRFTQMLFAGDTAPPPGSSPRPDPASPAVDPTITSARGRDRIVRVGEVLPSLERTITQRKIDIYSGVKPDSIHTDPDWARAKGFSATIAQGMMSSAHLSTMMTALAGEGFVVGGTIDCRFLRPVLCGDTLTLTGRIVGFAPESAVADKIRVHVEATAHNQRDEQTLSGVATGLLDPVAEN